MCKACRKIASCMRPTFVPSRTPWTPRWLYRPVLAQFHQAQFHVFTASVVPLRSVRRLSQASCSERTINTNQYMYTSYIYIYIIIQCLRHQTKLGMFLLHTSDLCSYPTRKSDSEHPAHYSQVICPTAKINGFSMFLPFGFTWTLAESLDGMRCQVPAYKPRRSDASTLWCFCRCFYEPAR